MLKVAHVQRKYNEPSAKSAVDALRHKPSYDRDQLYLKSCRSAQTFSTRRHELKFQLVAVSSIVSQGDLSRVYRILWILRLGIKNVQTDWTLLILNRLYFIFQNKWQMFKFRYRVPVRYHTLTIDPRRSFKCMSP